MASGAAGWTQRNNTRRQLTQRHKEQKGNLISYTPPLEKWAATPYRKGKNLKSAPHKQKRGVRPEKRGPLLWSDRKTVCDICVVRTKGQNFTYIFRNKTSKKSVVFTRKQQIFGPSVIIGLGKVQGNQWFAGCQQEVLSQIVRFKTVTRVITSRRRSFPTMYSRTSSGVRHNFSKFPSACAIQYPDSEKHTPYTVPFQAKTGSPPRIMHSLNSEIVLK